MKAIVQYEYGTEETLRIVELDKPVPKADQVLVNVAAVSLNAPDWRLLEGKPLMMRLAVGMFKPKYPVKGTDMAGTVIAVGKDVTRFKVGDEVYADLADQGFGAFAEYVCAKESILAHRPSNISLLESAALPLTSVTALQAVRDKAKVKEGSKVLIVGASGGVGSYALQIAKAFGAEVTAIVGTRSIEQAKGLGADVVIDHSTLDHSAEYPIPTTFGPFDAIVAINGHYPISNYRKLLTTTGNMVLVGSKSLSQILRLSAIGPFISKKDGQTFSALMARPNADDLGIIRDMVESGQIRPVIEREIAFEDIPKWIGILKQGHATGKIVAWVKDQGVSNN